jgi:hypothetical protein
VVEDEDLDVDSPEFSGVVEVATVVASHTYQEIDLMIPQKTSGGFHKISSSQVYLSISMTK